MIGDSNGNQYESEFDAVVGKPTQVADKPLQPADTSDWSAAAKEPDVYDFRKLTPAQQQDALRGYAVDFEGKTAADIAQAARESGSLRYGSGHPGLIELRKNLPKDLEIIDLHEFEPKAGEEGWRKLENGSGWENDFSGTTTIIRSKQNKVPVSILKADDHVHLASNSLEDFGQMIYRRFLDAFTPREGEPPRDSLEREGRNTFNREVRRSPADGTFRSRDELNQRWEHFTANRDAIPVEPRDYEQMREVWEPEELRRVRPALPGEQRPFIDPDDPRTVSEILDSLEEARRPRRTQPTEMERRGRVTPEAMEAANREWAERTGGAYRGSINFETNSGKSGVVAYTYDAGRKDLYVNWMGSRHGFSTKEDAVIKPHELGVDKVKEILTQLVEKHPEAKTITAERVSGVRARFDRPSHVTRNIADYLEPEAKPETKPARGGGGSRNGSLMVGGVGHFTGLPRGGNIWTGMSLNDVADMY